MCQLYGKLLNVSSEQQLSKFGMQTNVLKLISGEDMIYAEIKGKDKRLQFRNVGKQIILGNRFPKVEDNSLGWWDRVVVLNFPYEFVGDLCVPNIERRWLEDSDEVSGIFNFMLDGLYRLKENNEFSISKSAEETKVEFMRVSEPFNAWLCDCTVFVHDAILPRQEAYGSYRDYSDELGVEPDSQRVFYSKMRQTPRIKDVRVRIDGKRERAFQGLRLTNENDESGQVKLGFGPSGPDGPSSCTQKSLEVQEKGQYILPGQSGTSGTGGFNVEDYFPDGQFPVCFCCHFPISRVSELTSVGGKPVHRRCWAKVEAQKRKKSDDQETA